MFLLKKVLGILLLPLPLLIVLLAIGIVLSWTKARFRTGRTLATLVAVLLLLFSLSFLPYLLGRSLESRYQPFQPENALPEPEVIVVLGGGAGDDPSLPASTRLSPASLARLVEGVRIARIYPQSMMVFSGGQVFTQSAEAESMAEVARTLGVEENRLIMDTGSRDTEEQAVKLADMVAERPFVLVTSALHMPRAVALFRRQGVEPIPAPAGYRFDRSYLSGPRGVLPSAEHLRAMESILHEYYGFAWSWARRRV